MAIAIVDGKDGKVVLFDLTTDKTRQTFTLKNLGALPTSLAYSPSGKFLTIGQDQRKTELWSVGLGGTVTFNDTVRFWAGGPGSTRVFFSNNNVLTAVSGSSGATVSVDAVPFVFGTAMNLGSNLLGFAVDFLGKYAASGVWIPPNTSGLGLVEMYLWANKSKELASRWLFHNTPGGLAFVTQSLLAKQYTGGVTFASNRSGTLAGWLTWTGVPAGAWLKSGISASPDGKYVAVMRSDNVISIIRTSDVHQIQTLK